MKYRIELITRTGSELSWLYDDYKQAMRRWDKVVDNVMKGETCHLRGLPNMEIISTYTRAQ